MKRSERMREFERAWAEQLGLPYRNPTWFDKIRYKAKAIWYIIKSE